MATFPQSIGEFSNNSCPIDLFIKLLQGLGNKKNLRDCILFDGRINYFEDFEMNFK